MNRSILFCLLALAAAAASGCGADAPVPSSRTATADSAPAQDDGHAHAEVGLGKITLGELEVDLAQGHGVVAAGKESHLVVKLPYSDLGATVVRAWVGTENRTGSYVGKGKYMPAHDDYDVHATAPDPLPADPHWWIELELPDGTKLVGSADPLLE